MLFRSLRELFEGFKITGRPPRHARIDPRTLRDRDFIVENPPRDIRRTVQRHTERKYAPGEAPADLHVPGDNIAFQISAGTKNQTIGTDSPKDSSVDVQVSVRIKKALGRECFSKM